jgi:hypothetical protein
MGQINAGAEIDGQPAQTLAGLRQALHKRPHVVRFWPTAMSGPWSHPFPGDGQASKLDGWLGHNELRVAGPDPYTDRQWFASVHFDKGRLRVTG